jgi:hypothetical protein
MNRPLATLLLLLLFPAAAFAQRQPPQSAPPSTQPFPGISYHEQVRHEPPLRVYWIQADLTNPRLHLRLCPGGPPVDATWETTLMSVPKIAAREHLAVAVNGSFFAPRDTMTILGRKLPYFEANPARACGWAVSDGRLWSATPLGATYPSLVVGNDGRVSITQSSTPPRDARQVVSGCNLLLRDGRNVGPADALAPRCAVGLDAADRTLTLLVVDGRRPGYSVGLSMKQTADELLKLGCRQGLILDSGGSATMVVRHGDNWPVVNCPSDGHDLPIPISVPRPVANALGIVVDEN